MPSIMRLVRIQKLGCCRDHLDVGAAGAEQLQARLLSLALLWNAL